MYNFVYIVTNILDFAMQPVEYNPVFVFDLDYCLYYSQDLLNFEKAKEKELYEKHKLPDSPSYEFLLLENTTLSDMFVLHCKLSKSYYGQFIDNHNLSKFLKPSESLNKLLEDLPLRKVILSNAFKWRIGNVMSILKIEKYFETIFTPNFEFDDYILKPNIEVFRFVERYMNIKNPSQIYFFDDLKANVEGAKNAGWNSYLVEKGDLQSAISLAIKNLELLNSLKN